MQIRYAYVWRQPVGTAAFVLLSDHALAPLPAEDSFPVVDMGLLLGWSRAPMAELALDAQGSLVGYAARNGAGIVQSAQCAQNAGACHDAIEYWSDQAKWGEATLAASYEFGHELDVALAQNVHVQTRFQSPVLPSDPKARIDPQGKTAVASPDDYANMFARYERVRKALDEDSARAFFEANGYEVSIIDAMLKFDGIEGGIARLAATCPYIDSYEPFANFGGFGSLLIHHGTDEVSVYFIRRGSEWVVQQCGSG